MRSSKENEQSFGKRRLRVFVDANTIVSGLVFEGNQALLLKLGAVGACSLMTTRYVIDEVYKALAGKEFGLNGDEITTLLSVVYKTVVVHEDLKKLELKNYLPRLDDKKDVHVLAAYEKLKCDILVTSDRELLRKVPGSKTMRQTLKMLFGGLR
jgi:predicted nucleic acid-binding protein